MLMKQDTYGSKIRNLLSPVANTVSLIEAVETGKIDNETFVQFITKENLKYTLTKLLEISQKNLLENTPYSE